MTIHLDLFGMNELRKIKRGLDEANMKLDLLLKGNISHDLEKVIKEVSAKAKAIDKKVPDLP